MNESGYFKGTAFFVKNGEDHEEFMVAKHNSEDDFYKFFKDHVCSLDSSLSGNIFIDIDGPFETYTETITIDYSN